MAEILIPRVRRPARNRNFDAKLPRPAEPSTRDSILTGLGLAKRVVRRAEKAAVANGTSIETELIAARTLREDVYYEAMAERLGLAFLASPEAERVIVTPALDVLLNNPRGPLKVERDGRVQTLLAPRQEELESLSCLLNKHAGLRRSLAISPPRAIRDAVWAARGGARVEECRRALFETRPEASARVVATGWQGFFIALALFLSVVAGLKAAGPAMTTMHVLLSILFGSCMAVRLLAVFHYSPIRWMAGRPTGNGEANLPIYSILVALYDEAPVAAQLVRALDAMDWPRSKLDIKLVCEDNDASTIDALATLSLGPEYEIVRVPRIAPFTKPKALSYAMAGLRGELVVIYDAEDRPHPAQLRQAHALFAKSDGSLACIQAPLVIANARQSRIAGLFALEYAGLFRGLLPFLAAMGLPLPLGGTSNHFRTSVLREVGGWDPYNVTEDADLGIRLARNGYRFGMVAAPTLEDAPTTLRDWLLQRSRWYKGWMQTWLVMMRQPVRLLRQFGAAGFLSAQIVTAGMLMAALLSPFMAWFVMSGLVWPLLGFSQARSALQYALLGFDVLVICGTYAVFILLGLKAMTFKERFHVGFSWFWLPAYWIMMCVAAWHALYQLATRPFYWHKTPHRPTAEPSGCEAGGASGSDPAFTG